MSKDPNAATPYVHEAGDTKSITDGMSCWKDRHRMCGGDCVAFNPEAPEGSFERCHLLVFKSQQALGALMLAKRQPAPATAAAHSKADLFPPPPAGKKP